MNLRTTRATSTEEGRDATQETDIEILIITETMTTETARIKVDLRRIIMMIEMIAADEMNTVIETAKAALIVVSALVLMRSTAKCLLPTKREEADRRKAETEKIHSRGRETQKDRERRTPQSMTAIIGRPRRTTVAIAKTTQIDAPMRIGSKRNITRETTPKKNTSRTPHRKAKLGMVTGLRARPRASQPRASQRLGYQVLPLRRYL